VVTLVRNGGFELTDLGEGLGVDIPTVEYQRPSPHRNPSVLLWLANLLGEQNDETDSSDSGTEESQSAESSETQQWDTQQWEYRRPSPHQDPSIRSRRYELMSPLVRRIFENNHRNEQSAGNKCAVCNRGLPFNEFTRDSNEICDECMIQESLQMSQSANQRENDNILNPEHQNIPHNALNRSSLQNEIEDPFDFDLNVD
jgi:hypothetical protein